MNIIGFMALIGVCATFAAMAVMFNDDQSLALDCSKIKL